MILNIWFSGDDNPVQVRLDTEVEHVDALGMMLSKARWIAVDGGRLINLDRVCIIQLVPTDTPSEV
ncbi:MAG TPA: hypothetical protein PLB32_04770 [Acidobacteriota bacterium]|jgi:hypothetical protein|nr:hypothetical protein [Acidobacteriota bacterium]HNB71724.1 hypothetical protein [Acidobacteriota bacterium]HNG92087.1 hypothetical protein [Acidobacteriota bacterium]HNH84676.1 hypothetical protein [Acidobacteriota bacterium]